MKQTDSYEKKVHEKYYTRKDSGQITRYKWYKERFFKNVKGKRILEIGCGDGGVIQYLKDENEVYGADISKNAVRFLKEKGIRAHLVDISEDSLPFKTGFFDYVITLETLEHLKSPQYAIEEIQRILRKGGVLVTSVPNPRTGHKLMYPCLFRFANFKQYLANNRFFVRRATTYGICPPFWKHIRKTVIERWENQKKEIDIEEGESTMLSQIAGILSNDLFTKLKPKRYGWSFVYECLNVNPAGAKGLYTEIANETKGAY